MAESTRRKKVCVVGAGAAGLCAAKHLAGNSNFEAKVYEQTKDIGGTWVYKEATGLDENGLPIHSSMYRDLRFDSAQFCKIRRVDTVLGTAGTRAFFVEPIYQRGS